MGEEKVETGQGTGSWTEMIRGEKIGMYIFLNLSQDYHRNEHSNVTFLFLSQKNRYSKDGKQQKTIVKFTQLHYSVTKEQLKVSIFLHKRAYARSMGL